MNLKDVVELVINPGLSLLSPIMGSMQAKAMLIAIGLQESRFISRKQIGGPARGFYQFESGGGVKGVLNHRYTKPLINSVLSILEIPANQEDCYEAIAWNDALATVFARLLLWTVPEDLPGEKEYDESWRQYTSAWRPGKPRRESWDKYYAIAWSAVI